jgi:hypothetical protein
VRTKRCVDCRQPGDKSICDPCKAERRRLWRLHVAEGDLEQDERYGAMKAGRVSSYAQRAERELPLFEVSR